MSDFDDASGVYEQHDKESLDEHSQMKTTLISFRLANTEASQVLCQRWAKSDRESWSLQLGEGLPVIKIVNIENRWEDVALMTEIPTHIHAKTLSWGYTQWCSSLIRPDMAPKSLLGIRYVDDKVRQEIRAVLCLLVIAPIFSLAQIILVSFAQGLQVVWLIILCIAVVAVETCPFMMAFWRKFHIIFNLWQLVMCIDLLVKTGGAVYEFVKAIQTIDRESAKGEKHNSVAWSNIGSLFGSVLAIFVAVCLLWLTRRLRKLMRLEDNMASILLSVERPKKVLSVKPLALWAVGSLPSLRHTETASLMSTRALTPA